MKGPILDLGVEDGVLSPASLNDVFQSLPEGVAYSDRGFLIFVMGH